MKHTSLLLIAGFALMACTPGEPTAPSSTGAADPSVATAPAATPEPSTPMPPPDASAAAPTTAGDTCNMAQYATLIGKPVTDGGVPPASPTVRIIKPDTQVTMDFVAARLNIEVNSTGVITNVKCG